MDDSLDPIDIEQDFHECLLIAENSATTLIESSRFGALRHSVRRNAGLRAEIYKRGNLISAAASFGGINTYAANELVKCASEKNGAKTPKFPQFYKFPTHLDALPLWDRKFIEETESKLQEFLRALPQNIAASISFHRTVTQLTFFRMESVVQEIRDVWGVAIDFCEKGCSSGESLFREGGGSGQPDLDTYIRETLSEFEFVVSRMRDVQDVPFNTNRFVFSPKAASILFHEAIGHALEEKVLRKVLTGYRAGDRYLPIFMNIHDNPSDIHLFGHSKLDDVGRATSDQLLIKDGSIVACFGAQSFAKERGFIPILSHWRQDLMRPALNRMRNLIVEPGEASLDTLILDAEGGVYVERMSEGCINMTSGEFSLLVSESYLIVGGKKTKRLTPFRIVTHLSRLKSGLVGISNDVSQAAMYCNTGGSTCPNGVRSPGCLLWGGRIEPLHGVGG